MTSGEANIRGDCIINPRASGGLGSPQTPCQNSLSLLHQTLLCKVKHGGGKNEENPLKPFLSDILLILCSVMGITITVVEIISLHRKSSKVAEVKKSLATYAFISSPERKAHR